MKNLWNPAPDKYQWVEKFKDIFINQKKDFLKDIFDKENFGLHNAVSLKDYTDYEFHEFEMKCANFGLTMQASIVCYDLKDDFFYFALGKKEDNALFEAIFRWDNKKQLAIGNQYQFKIEPKMQFFKKMGIKEEFSRKRKINIKPIGNMKIKKVLNSEMSENNILIKNELEEHLGGNFYSSVYDRLQEDDKTYWDKLHIVTSEGIIKQDVLMRGQDHPLFQDNLYPHISEDKKSASYMAHLYPVIVYVLLESGEELFYKYPKQKSWSFNEKISSICLTDTLSFDWIVY